MSRPRLIIADTDINYIIPLQIQFIEYYFEKIDLEIITDVAYFRSFFSEPQKAEVLIISEELYSPDINKHNINSIYMMAETDEESVPDNQDVIRIYKYTSIGKIFNEIVGRSKDIFEALENGKSEPQIVLVSSASGGVGKTTVAVGLSACLAKNYKRVLYINASWMQCFQILFDEQAAISDEEVYDILQNPQDSIYDDIQKTLRTESFTYLPPFKAPLISLGVNYSVFARLAISAKAANAYDYIIIDAESQFDEGQAELLSIADKVVIVTGQNTASVYSTKIWASNINGVDPEKYIFVCNDFYRNRPNSLIEQSDDSSFTVSDYIEHIENYDEMKASTFARIGSLQRITYLIL